MCDKCCILFVTKTFIPPGIFLVFRWQLSPIQMKCKGKANYSTYIIFVFFVTLSYILGPFKNILPELFRNLIFVLI